MRFHGSQVAVAGSGVEMVVFRLSPLVESPVDHLALTRSGIAFATDPQKATENDERLVGVLSWDAGKNVPPFA